MTSKRWNEKVVPRRALLGGIERVVQVRVGDSEVNLTLSVSQIWGAYAIWICRTHPKLMPRGSFANINIQWYVYLYVPVQTQSPILPRGIYLPSHLVQLLHMPCYTNWVVVILKRKLEAVLSNFLLSRSISYCHSVYRSCVCGFELSATVVKCDLPASYELKWCAGTTFYVEYTGTYARLSSYLLSTPRCSSWKQVLHVGLAFWCSLFSRDSIYLHGPLNTRPNMRLHRKTNGANLQQYLGLVWVH